MTSSAERRREIGPRFPGTVALTILRLLVPAGHREEVTGDLIEEAETLVLPRHGLHAARSWFWWQIVSSVPHLITSHWTRSVRRNPQRWLVAATIIVMCTLMAMDGGLLSATPRVVALVAFAIFIPAAAGLLSGSIAAYAGAAATSALLLGLARLMSHTQLRWYAIAFMAFVVLLLDWSYEHRSRPSAPGGGPSAPM